MAWVALVRVDATMGTIRATASFGGLLDHDALDDQVFKFHVLCISIGFRILQKTRNKSDGFLGPATLRRLELFYLCCPANTTRETAERNGLSVFKDVTKVRVSLGQFQARKRSSDFSHVLEVRAEVLSSSTGGFFWVGGKSGGGVTNHLEESIEHNAQFLRGWRKVCGLNLECTVAGSCRFPPT